MSLLLLLLSASADGFAPSATSLHLRVPVSRARASFVMASTRTAPSLGLSPNPNQLERPRFECSRLNCYTNTMLIMVDMEESSRKSIYALPGVIKVSEKMLAAAGAFVGVVPFVATTTGGKSNPQPLLKELSVASGLLHPEHVVAKKRFSAFTPTIQEQLKNERITNVVVWGLSAHTAVQQTVYDLVEQGYHVHVLADGTSSGTRLDRSMAIRNMERAGARITTADSFLYEILHRSDHPLYERVLDIMEKHRPSRREQALLDEI